MLKVLLGVTGSIAVYKACTLANLLRKEGCVVKVVMTSASKKFVTPLTFRAITGNYVSDDIFKSEGEGGLGHIDLAQWADVVVIAPATANFLARASRGFANDLLSAILLVSRAPLFLAPSMNPKMYDNIGVFENIGKLKKNGAIFLGPEDGTTICGDVGLGRMLDPQKIVESIFAFFIPKDLNSTKILITAGPTREYFDPVRFISNPSSGLMGIEIARACFNRGAEVLLILGPTTLEPPSGVCTLKVTTAEEMYNAVMNNAKDSDVIIKAAAVSDFKPEVYSEEKIKKKNDVLNFHCELKKTSDILKNLGQMKGEALLIGFAAETEDILLNARRKMVDKNLDLIVANDVSCSDRGFAVKNNKVIFILPSGKIKKFPLMTKKEVSSCLCDWVVQKLEFIN